MTHCTHVNAFPNNNLWTLPILKDLDNSKNDENGGKFYKKTETTVGKIAHPEQFFLFPQCF